MTKALSPGEWQILLALWRLGRRATVDEVVQELGQEPAPSSAVVRTLLSRAMKKGYVGSAVEATRRDGPQRPGRPESRYFWPTKDREAATRDEFRRFVSVYLGDDPESVEILKGIVREEGAGGRGKRGGEK